MNQDLLNMLLQSPVIVAVVGVIATILTSISKKPKTDNVYNDDKTIQWHADRLDEMMQISRNLDRHINNNHTPMRTELNMKLDAISTSLEAITETTKSSNMNMQNISRRVDILEQDVSSLKLYVEEIHG